MASTRSERRVMATLNRLIQNKQLSKNGMDWLIVATDPFHDTEVSCEGFPDVTSSRTIVQCVNQTMNVATPLETDDNWDCHVFLFPTTPSWDPGNGSTILPGAFYQTQCGVGGVLGVSLLSYLPIFSGYNVITCPNNTAWTAATTSNGTSSPSVSWPTTFGAGQVRLIGAGFEITNTTAEIYKQGSITSYRSPSCVTNGQVTADIDPDGRYNQYIEWTTLPPQTQAEAALYPNSKTWGAVDGIYSIATLNTNQNPFKSPNPGWSGMLQVPTEPSLLAQDARLCFTPGLILSGSDIVYASQPSCRAIDFDVHGCVLSGLSSQTTLQITTRYYFERIPSASDPNLLVLCKPSPSYDPLALEIYSHAVSSLPVAVKVDENPMGEWFEDVMNTVAAVIPMAGAALNAVVPGAGIVGSGIGAASKAIAAANNRARSAENAARQANQTATAARVQATKAIAAAKSRPARPLSSAATRAQPRKKKGKGK